jgi:N-acetylneuraminic acid mutarotase
VWVAKNKMPTAREAFAAAVVSGNLFAFGGRLNESVIAASHVYDAATNSWTSRAAMPQPRASSRYAYSHGGSGVLGGKLYVFGICGPDGRPRAGCMPMTR